eukprot:1286421-Amphidinium_carterae.1
MAGTRFSQNSAGKSRPPRRSIYGAWQDALQTAYPSSGGELNAPGGAMLTRGNLPFTRVMVVHVDHLAATKQ